MPTRFDLEWDDPIGHFEHNVGLDLFFGAREIGKHIKETKETGKEDAKELQSIKEWIEAVFDDENLPEIRAYGDRGVKKSLDALEWFYKSKFHKLPDTRLQKATSPKDQTNPIKQKSQKRRETISDKALRMLDEGKNWREEIAPSCFKKWNEWPESKRKANLKRLRDSVYSKRHRNKKRAMSQSHN